MKFPALFIVIKVPPIIPPLQKRPRPYIMLITTEARGKKRLTFVQFVGKTEAGGVQSVLRPERNRAAALWAGVVIPKCP